MTYAEIATMVESVGLPFAYHHFPDKSGQQPPFICFFYPQSADMLADGTNYKRINSLTVELYTDNKDFALEKQVETVLNGSGLVWQKDEFYIDEERMYLESYMTEVLIEDE